MNPEFVAQVRETFPAKDSPLLLLCRSGVRSVTAGELLLQDDYDDLVNVEGGFLSWVDSGFDYVT